MRLNLQPVPLCAKSVERFLELGSLLIELGLERHKQRVGKRDSAMEWLKSATKIT